MKILLVGPLSPYSGYGGDLIAMAQTMVKMGIDLYLLPNAVQAPLPPEVAALLTKEVKGPFDLTLVHQDPGSLDVRDAVRSSSDLVVGWTMWEWSSLHAMAGRSSLRKRLKGFDALVGYDHVSTHALKDYYSGPLLTQQGGYPAQDWPQVGRDWTSDEFYFAQIGVLSSRKDPFVTIAAFAAAKNADAEFNKNARCLLKTSTPGLHSKMEDIYSGLRIFYDVWPREVVRQFYANAHVLVAPSRGEGKNLPALEFLSTGGPVIATDWGGHTEWMHPDYAYPLKYHLAADDPQKPEVLNARASTEHLTELMLHTFHHRAETQHKGEVGAQVIPLLSGWDPVIVRLFDKLRAIPGGDVLGMKFDMARREMA